MEGSPGSRGFEDKADRVELPIDDATLREIVLNPETSAELYGADPVLWMRAAIGVDTERDASTVTNRDLVIAHNEGGFAEWDPHAARTIAQYLTDMGFFVVGSSRLEDDIEADAEPVAEAETGEIDDEQEVGPSDRHSLLARLMIENA
jgi:hypothetical protein